MALTEIVLLTVLALQLQPACFNNQNRKISLPCSPPELLRATETTSTPEPSPTETSVSSAGSDPMPKSSLFPAVPRSPTELLRTTETSTLADGSPPKPSPTDTFISGAASDPKPKILPPVAVTRRNLENLLSASSESPKYPCNCRCLCKAVSCPTTATSTPAPAPAPATSPGRLVAKMIYNNFKRKLYLGWAAVITLYNLAIYFIGCWTPKKVLELEACLAKANLIFQHEMDPVVDKDMAGGDGDAVAGGDGDARAGGDGDAVAGGDGDALAGGDGDAVAGGDGDALAGGDGDAVAGGDGDAVAGIDDQEEEGDYVAQRFREGEESVHQLEEPVHQHEVTNQVSTPRRRFRPYLKHHMKSIYYFGLGLMLIELLFHFGVPVAELLLKQEERFAETPGLEELQALMMAIMALKEFIKF